MLSKLGFLALASIPAALAVEWTTFQDPIEKAFTIDVPTGWTAKGGLFRLGYSDYRPMVDLQSPDGKVNIRLGDISIPTYSVPNQFHAQEGSVVDLGAQAQMTVAQYRPGEEYAALYARVRFHDTCPVLAPQKLAGIASMPDTPEEALVKHSSAGEAAYSCGGARIAYVYAKTALYGTFWQVHTLASLVAPQDQVRAAHAIVERGVKSFKFTPAWIEYQNKLDQEALVYQRQRQQMRRRVLAQQVAQFEMRMQAMQNQVAAFEHRQAGQAAQVESWGNILTEITPTTDPLGNPRNVWTGSKSGYWTDGQGNVVNSDLSPGAGWQALQPKQ